MNFIDIMTLQTFPFLMLKTLRKKGVAKKILWFVAIVIVITFGFFGTANYLNRRKIIPYAGKIFNTTISHEEFENSLQHARLQAIMRLGDNFYKMQQYLNLESEAWDRLILLHEAKKRKIQVPDKDVVKAVENMDFFKRNGEFDTGLYDQIVTHVFRSSRREFEEGIREILALSKLRDMVTVSTVVDENEARQLYKTKNEKV